MKIGIGKRITPGTIAPHHAVTAVRDDHSGEKVIFLFHREVETTAVIGAYNGFQECVSFRDRLIDISSDPKRDTPGCGDDFQRDKRTDIADYLFPFLFQLLRPEPVVLIIFFYCVKDVSLFLAHHSLLFTPPLSENHLMSLLRGIYIIFPYVSILLS